MRQIEAELGGSAEYQRDLGQLWNDLEKSPRFQEQELLKKSADQWIGIKQQGSDSETYRVVQLAGTPTETAYAAKPYHIMPKEGASAATASITFYVEKWPNGYRISGDPATRDFDNNIFVHKGEAQYLDVGQPIVGEATELLAKTKVAKERMRKAK